MERGAIDLLPAAAEKVNRLMSGKSRSQFRDNIREVNKKLDGAFDARWVVDEEYGSVREGSDG